MLLRFHRAGPFLRALSHEPDDVGGHVAGLIFRHRRSPFPSPSTTIADLPLSVYVTRGHARCSTAMTGCEVLARTSARMPSSPSPLRPSCRKGLLMPGDQFTPVMTLRLGAGPAVRPSRWIPNANSMTRGAPF